MPAFIGREAELARLEAALADRATTPGLFLGGEVGLGKSRLIGQFADRAGASGATVAIGGCLEFGAAALPFAPFVEALGRLYEDLAARGAPAARAVPAELAAVIPQLGSPPRHAARVRLFEAVRSFLEDAPDPLILVIEDIHWIDHSSLALLSYLIRRLRHGRVLVAATFRNDEVGPGAPRCNRHR